MDWLSGPVNSFYPIRMSVLRDKVLRSVCVTPGCCFRFSPFNFRSFVPPKCVKHFIITISLNFLFVCLFQVLHRVGPSSQPVYVVKGLKPYHVYNFTVTLCTKMGCITSLPTTARTLPAGKNKNTKKILKHTWMQTWTYMLHGIRTVRIWHIWRWSKFSKIPHVVLIIEVCGIVFITTATRASDKSTRASKSTQSVTGHLSGDSTGHVNQRGYSWRAAVKTIYC